MPLDEDPIQELPAPRRPAKNPTKKVDHSKDYVEKKAVRRMSEREEVKAKLKKRKR